MKKLMLCRLPFTLVILLSLFSVPQTSLAQGDDYITVDANTRTVENSKIRISWDLANAEFVNGLYFKPYSSDTNLTNFFGGELFGNAIAWHPSENYILYGLVSDVNTDSIWAYTFEDNIVRILISSTSSDGYQISTRYEITSNSPVIKVERTFHFSKKSIEASRIETFRIRAYPRSDFTRYVWKKANGTIGVIDGSNTCEAGCQIIDWAQTWVDLETSNIGIGLVNTTSHPLSGLWLDRDLYSYTSSISGLIANDNGFNQDVTVSYLIIPHMKDYTALEFTGFQWPFTTKRGIYGYPYWYDPEIDIGLKFYDEGIYNRSCGTNTHWAVDFVAKENNATVYAVANGYIELIDDNPLGFGQYIVIKHPLPDNVLSSTSWHK